MSTIELEQPAAEPYIAVYTASKVDVPEEVPNQHEQAIRTAMSQTPSGNQKAEIRGKVPDTKFEFSSESLPAPPVFQDKYKEREYMKQRLTLAFRVFAKLGFDCGIAGHITLRVGRSSNHYCTVLTADIGSGRSYFILAKPIRSPMASFRVKRLDSR